MLLTSLSKNPPCHGESGRWNFHLMPNRLTNFCVSTNTKSLPPSEIMHFGHPRLLMNLLIIRMNELASNHGATSKITPWLGAHVNKVTYCPTLNRNSILHTTGQNYLFWLRKMHNYQIISILSKKEWLDTGTVALHVFYIKNNFLESSKQSFCLDIIKVFASILWEFA